MTTTTETPTGEPKVGTPADDSTAKNEEQKAPRRRPIWNQVRRIAVSSKNGAKRVGSWVAAKVRKGGAKVGVGARYAGRGVRGAVFWVALAVWRVCRFAAHLIKAVAFAATELITGVATLAVVIVFVVLLVIFVTVVMVMAILIQLVINLARAVRALFDPRNQGRTHDNVVPWPSSARFSELVSTLDKVTEPAEEETPEEPVIPTEPPLASQPLSVAEVTRWLNNHQELLQQFHGDAQSRSTSHSEQRGRERFIECLQQGPGALLAQNQEYAKVYQEIKSDPSVNKTSFKGGWDAEASLVRSMVYNDMRPGAVA